MALDSGAGIMIGENQWREFGSGSSAPIDESVWLKETVLAAWGKPKETKVEVPKVESEVFKLPQIDFPKVPRIDPRVIEKPKPEQKNDETPTQPSKVELEKIWKTMQPEVSLDGNVKEIEFSNGDRLKFGARGGWTLFDKNGKEIKIVEDLTKGRSTLHEYRLSNGATYFSGCFNSGISYPNGDSISFGFGLRTRGGRVVARY